ncbi:MAG: DUF1836 domain-containing protein [Bacillota bacterium]|nr:DUF1836 domain-containing protein [Bacillota bacterium]
MEGKFNIEYVRKIAKEISKANIVSYEELPQYDLFISQVTDYLNDKFQDEKYTSNIIQNYIKGEIISKPQGGKKRGYTKEHLAQLVLLSYMRPILATEEIKKVFSLVFKDINNSDDDILSWEKAYEVFSDIQENVYEDFLSEEHFNEKELLKLINKNSLNDRDQEGVLVFLVVMTLIAQASAIKKLAKRLVDEYSEDE